MSLRTGAIAALVLALGASAQAQPTRGSTNQRNPNFGDLDPIRQSPADLAAGHLAAGDRELAQAEKLRRKLADAKKPGRVDNRRREALGRALSEFELAVTLAPELAAGFAGRGAALRGLDRHNEAFDSFGAALQIAPDDARLLRHWVTSLIDLGRLDDAMAAHDSLNASRPAQAEVLVDTLRAWLGDRPPGSAAERELHDWLQAR